MKLTALILAAGMGSRYGGLKQLDEIGPNGETIIDYSLYDAIAVGFKKAVFVIQKEFDQIFQEKVISKFKDHIETECVYQELSELPNGYSVPKGRTKPWGTGHAILTAKHIREPFVLVNGDDFFGTESFRIMADFLTKQSSSPNNETKNNYSHYSMVGFKLSNTLSDYGPVSRGICKTDNDNFLIEMTEHTKIAKKNDVIESTDSFGKSHPLTGNEIVSMNMFGFTPSLFNHLEKQFEQFLKNHSNDLTKEFYIPSAVNELIKNNQADVQVLNSKDQWFGVTYKEDKRNSQDSIKHLIQNGAYPQKLWA